MLITTKHIGSYGGNPASIIELTVKGSNTELMEDVTDMKNMVDYDFIQNLREIADELEEHNQLVANQTDFK
jgi:hypothetical protein